MLNKDETVVLYTLFRQEILEKDITGKQLLALEYVELLKAITLGIYAS